MRIYIIRHGETRQNHEGIIQGRLNSSLLERGERMAESVGKALGKKKIKFDAAFTSPLKRALCTGKAVLNNSGNTHIELKPDSRIMEIDLGTAEGKHYRDTECEIDERLRDLFFKDPFHFHGFPKGESTLQVIERTHAFLFWLLSQPYNCVLVSTHGFALRGLLNCVYENPSEYWHGHVPYNCSISILETHEDVTASKGVSINNDAAYTTHFNYLDSLLEKNNAKPCVSTYLRKQLRLVEDDTVLYDSSLIVDNFQAHKKGLKNQPSEKDNLN